jgi:hypothetical protein
MNSEEAGQRAKKREPAGSPHIRVYQLLGSRRQVMLLM